jgi:EAL domain-containing protein (putative c-di-GMP-specific phosphodiesterase class I)
VETVEQRDFLRANDCDEMQGYLFSPPVPAERITELLQAQQRQPREVTQLSTQLSTQLRA